MKNIKSYFSSIKGKRVVSIIYIIVLLCVLFKGVFVTSWGAGANYNNVSVRATVNVTNAYPEILNVSCNDGSAITLNGGSTKAVICLVQIRDYNDGDTVTGVNGTFYYYLNASSDPEDNNTHYTNTSCLENSTNGYYTNWTCAFDVWYYANNGTWQANITVNDSFATTDNDYGNTSINGLLALNVSELIDYGDLPVTQTSDSIEANVTNFGNIPINVTVYGFGGDNDTGGAGLAMICEQRNLTLDNERYSLNNTATYDVMTPLTSSPSTLPGFQLTKQTVAGVPVLNGTYWRLHINVTTNPFGVCNGTVVFTAISP